MTRTSAPPVITGLDLPAGSPGGSVELLHDLYIGPSAPLAAQVFMLTRASHAATPSGEPELLTVPGKCADGPRFWQYVADLTCALSAAFTPPADAVAHLQHLTFGASPALIGAFPRLRRIALWPGHLQLRSRTRARAAARHLAAHRNPRHLHPAARPVMRPGFRHPPVAGPRIHRS